eukprot:scaffold21589_cov56-Attheya_sp.AAC.3
MLYTQAVTVCLLAISLSKANGQESASVRDIDMQANLKVLVGDGAENRHSLGIDELNQENPEGCTVDIDGNFLFSDFESATEIELGFVYEIVTRGVSTQQLEVEILPMLERKLSNTVLADTFVNSCLGERLRRFLESRKLEVVGLRTAPPDAVLDGETCGSSVVTSGDQCRKIEGGMVIYSDNTSDQDDIAMLQLVDDAMTSGSLLNVSDKIVSVTYVERIVDNVTVTPIDNVTDDEQQPLSSSEGGLPAWGWSLLVVGAVSILFAMALLYRLRYQEDYEYEDGGEPFIDENNYEDETQYADLEPAQTYDRGPPQFDGDDQNYDDTYYDQRQPAQSYDQNYETSDQGQPAQSYDQNYDEEPLNGSGASSDDYAAPRTTKKKKKSRNRGYDEEGQDDILYGGDGQGYDRPMFQA